MEITVVYDNNSYNKRLKTAWGFASVVRLRGTTILFDTGGNGAVLLSNMRRLGMKPAEIDMVVLSHIHGDHTGGLLAFLRENRDVTVVVPASFPKQFKEEVCASGGRVKEIRGHELLAPHLHSTGVLGGGIKEQSLIIQSEAGLVIITGCAHPGITQIIERSRQLLEGDVALVLGGFHLGGKTASQLAVIIERFEELGVSLVAPCHCTGDRARAMFKKAYGDRYFPAGVGYTIASRDLKTAGPSKP